MTDKEVVDFAKNIATIQSTLTKRRPIRLPDGGKIKFSASQHDICVYYAAPGSWLQTWELVDDRLVVWGRPYTTYNLYDVIRHNHGFIIESIKRFAMEKNRRLAKIRSALDEALNNLSNETIHQTWHAIMDVAKETGQKNIKIKVEEDTVNVSVWSTSIHIWSATSHIYEYITRNETCIMYGNKTNTIISNLPIIANYIWYYLSAYQTEVRDIIININNIRSQG